jgi:hypothetical protein
MSYESIRIRDEDYETAKSIRVETALPIIDSVGVAIQGWQLLPAKTRQRLIRQRTQRADRIDRRRPKSAA